MNADWTSAGNESREGGIKKKKKQAPSLLCDSITSENFYSRGDLFIWWWWIQFVRKWKGQGWHARGAAVTWGQHCEGMGENPSAWGDQRGLGKGKGARTPSEDEHKAKTSIQLSGMQDSQGNSGEETRPGMSVPFPAAHFNLLNTTPGQNNVRFVSNFIANQNLILACRRSDEQRDRF